MVEIDSVKLSEWWKYLARTILFGILIEHLIPSNVFLYIGSCRGGDKIYRSVLCWIVGHVPGNLKCGYSSLPLWFVAGRQLGYDITYGLC
jgi:hypothetical protein